MCVGKAGGHAQSPKGGATELRANRRCAHDFLKIGGESGAQREDGISGQAF